MSIPPLDQRPRHERQGESSPDRARHSSGPTSGQGRGIGAAVPDEGAWWDAFDFPPTTAGSLRPSGRASGKSIAAFCGRSGSPVGAGRTSPDPWKGGEMPGPTLIGRLRLALASSQEGLHAVARRAEVPRRSLARFVAGEGGLTFEAAAAVVRALGLRPIPARSPRRS